MDLLEYQAKELFREVGIPVLPSQTIEESRELKQLRIPYPVVLKSQVRVGGRGKAGGIRFVANTIDAIAAARAIFNLSIVGEYPEVILAEAQYDSQQEFFLAVVLDYDLQYPVLLGSAQGGMNVEPLLENLQQVVVDTEFSPFLARRLATKMGLTGDLLQSVSDVIGKMYRLFWEKDLEVIEINPLGVSALGELMALDGKITVNDYAWARHSEFVTLNSSSQRLLRRDPSQDSGSEPALTVGQLSTVDFPPKLQWLDWQDEKGKIAILCNHQDLALLTWDLICQSKGKPACAAVIDLNQRELELAQQIEALLAQLSAIKGLKVVLINILADQATNQALVDAIADYVFNRDEGKIKSTGEERMLVANGAVSRSRSPATSKSANEKKKLSSVKFVLRLVNYKLDLFDQEAGEEVVYCLDSLTEAITQSISLAKSK